MLKIGSAISRVMIAGALAAAVLEVGSLPATAAPIGRQHLDFNFTGADQFFTVPSNTGQIMVTAQGGAGAPATGPRGAAGIGDLVTGVINVQPGEVLRIRVGGGGGNPDASSGGWNGGGAGGHQGGPAGNDGGGGGGASEVSIVKPGSSGVTNWVRVIVAGGGGGGGGSQAGIGGDGGDGGSYGRPGSGGTPSLAGCFRVPGFPTSPGQNGVGGAGSTGLNCGAGSPGTGGNGTGSAGGNGANAACCVGGGGGGGGGGYGGGGGGGAPDSAGGGGDGGAGGGSLGTSMHPFLQAGDDGLVSLDWVGGAPTAISILLSPAAPVAGQSVTLSATVNPVPAGGTVQFSIDGQDFGAPVSVDTTTGIATSDPITGLAVGSHVFGGFYSGSTDFSANAGFAPSQASLTVPVVPDTDPPVVTVAAPSPLTGQNGFFNISDLASAGGSITVSVSASDTSGTVTDLACTDNGQAVGVSNQTGSNPRTGAVSLAANGFHAIGCTATDSAGNSGNNGGPNTAKVSIDTTAPSVTVPAAALAVDATSQAGALVSSYPVSTSDLDPGDIPAVTCGPAVPNLFAIGDTTVTCQVTDQAGNSGQAQSFTVHVKAATEELSDLASAVQGVGPGASLAAKVRAAENSLSLGGSASACAALIAFTHEVRAQIGQSISAAEANQLTSDAARIHNVIGCP